MTKKTASAADVLSRLEGVGVTPAPVRTVTDGAVGDTVTPLDALQGIASVMLSGEIVEPLVEDALAHNEPFPLADLNPKRAGGVNGLGVLLNPVFVEAAASRGRVFFLHNDGLVHCAVIGERSSPLPRPPVHDTATAEPDFYLQPSWFAELSAFIERKTPVLLIGPAGSGKSEAVERAFAAREQHLQIVSCTPRTTANDLEGDVDLVIDEETQQQVTRFTPAAPAVASEQGHGLLIDEADAAPPQAMYGLYRLIDGKSMHITRKGHEGVVTLHPEFRVVGTQNTEGRGDDLGLYHGRSYQDEAFLDRWENVIRVDYPTPDDEVMILRKRTGISGSAAEKLVKSAAALRVALGREDIMFTCSLRRTLAVSRNLASGLRPEAAWTFAVVNRAMPRDGVRIREILNRIYGSEIKK